MKDGHRHGRACRWAALRCFDSLSNRKLGTATSRCQESTQNGHVDVLRCSEMPEFPGFRARHCTRTHKNSRSCRRRKTDNSPNFIHISLPLLGLPIIPLQRRGGASARFRRPLDRLGGRSSGAARWLRTRTLLSVAGLTRSAHQSTGAVAGLLRAKVGKRLERRRGSGRQPRIRYAVGISRLGLSKSRAAARCRGYSAASAAATLPTLISSTSNTSVEQGGMVPAPCSP